MGPRFIESKKRGNTGILQGKGNRKARKKVTINKPLASRLPAATNDETVPVHGKNPISVELGQFIGGELLEYDGPSCSGVKNEEASDRSATRPCLEHRQASTLNQTSRCLAFDTRTLFDSSSAKCYGSITTHLNKFLDHLTKRGYKVPVQASTVLDPTKRAKILSHNEESGVTREISYVSAVGIKASQSIERDLLQDAPISSAITCSSGEIKLEEIPNTLTAGFTWKLMADLVHAMIEIKGKEASSDPMDVAILSSEVAFFADADKQAHLSGFDSFVKRVASFYSNAQIGSIHFVLISSGVICNAQEHRSYEETLALCTKTLRQKMEDVLYKHLPSGGEVTAVEKRVRVSIERIRPGDIECLALARRWVRDSIRRHDHCLTLDLPETSDGSQCSVTFDISYQLCPISLSNPLINDFLADLKHIVTSGLEVVHRLPLSSLDASLLFGVPFTLQAGCLDTDLDRYRETQTIVATLLRILDEREEALLLTTKRSSANQADKPGLFVSGTSNQKFVFMAKHVGAGFSPTKAIVFRMADDTHLLADAGTSSLNSTLLDNDTALQYSAYLESSLSILECRAYNPMVSPRGQSSKSTTIDSSSISDYVTNHQSVSPSEPALIAVDEGSRKQFADH